VNTIKQCRSSRNLTQKDLANYLGVTKSTISKLENDKARPSLDLAIKISKFFNVSLDKLFLKNSGL
jgi:putative transcriptional regulator